MAEVTPPTSIKVNSAKSSSLRSAPKQMNNTNSLKRKVLQELLEISKKEKVTNAENATPERQTNLYPNSHVGPAYVDVKLKGQTLKKSRVQNLNHIVKAVNLMNAGVSEIKPRSIGTAELKFPSKESANTFVQSMKAEKSDLEAFIPYYRTEKRGLVKEIPSNASMEEIVHKSESPAKIVNAIRLNRKTYDQENKKASWLPSETVLITFEGNTLPNHIKIYGILNIQVHIYIEALKMCFKCMKYGHSSGRCGSTCVCQVTITS
ncbi:uncharacterized protein LOC114881190 [Osmia bicornis bicornis]|uniref:uncharacterized protein LOC114881190 n=1 Tax=Osmia bicornis bicornis TaxID=1437191 RepID=UPI0010F5D963|nr:uncharacterized protein LOC114881190 [Osmia bicornis bicornis]